MSRPSFEMVATALAETAARWSTRAFSDRIEATRLTLERPNTFTREAIDYAIDSIMPKITVDGLRRWIGDRVSPSQETVAVLNAGNVPFVGLQDLLAALIAGHRYCGVLSSKSPHLLPAFCDNLRTAVPGIPIEFDSLDNALSRSDRLLATGADTTISTVSAAAARAGIDRTRQLCRGTRFSVGIVDGQESEDELLGIAKDALLHEGRGCLNASIIFAPTAFPLPGLLLAFSLVRVKFPPHQDTLDTVEHERRFFAATGQRFAGGAGFVFVEADPHPRRPGVVVLTRYGSISEVENWIRRNENRLQTVTTAKRVVLNTGSVETCEAGSSQDPPLDWRPDRIDAIEFLTGP